MRDNGLFDKGYWLDVFGFVFIVVTSVLVSHLLHVWFL